jgi:hypothetical protein
MDQEQRTELSNRYNPDTAARIVRGISDIQRDFGLAYGPFSEDLSREIVKAMARAIADPWQFFEGDWTATMMLAGWKSARGVNTQDAWLEFGEICAEEDASYTWIGAAVGVGPARLGLEFKVRRGLLELAQKAIGNVTKVQALLDAGFVRDEANERFYLPIAMPAEALAMGFEMNDLAEAVAPAARAVELAMAAHAELDAFVESLRADAKHK